MDIPKKMRAVVIEGADTFGIREIDTPAPGRGEVLVRIRAIAICGSDPGIFSGRSLGFWPPAYPFVAGNEWSGEIVALGKDVADFVVGERVAGESHKGCGSCENCRRGAYNLCLHYGNNERQHRHYGFTSRGAYAEYNAYSTLAITRIPDNVDFEEASLCDTAGIALHGIELSGITPGGTVVVFGPGPVGMMAMLLARTSGAGTVIMVGRGPRLQHARTLGADLTVDFEKEDVVQVIRDHTGSVGADEVFECSGASLALSNSIKSVRKGGTVVLLGNPPDWTSDNVPIREIVLNEIAVLGSRANPNTLHKVASMLRSRTVDFRRMITHTFPLEQFAEALDVFVTRRDGALKVVVTP